MTENPRNKKESGIPLEMQKLNLCREIIVYFSMYVSHSSFLVCNLCFLFLICELLCLRGRVKIEISIPAPIICVTSESEVAIYRIVICAASANDRRGE